MSDEITPQATPIATTGEPEWFPPPQDDDTLQHDVGQQRPEESPLHKVFYGRDGLRAGWSLLLFILFTVLLVQLMGKVLHAVAPRPKGAPAPEWLMMSQSAILFVITGLAGYIVSLIEHRPWSAYGINSLRGRLGQVAQGKLLGFGLLSLLVGILWSTGKLTFAGMNLHGAGSIVLWALLFGLSFLGVALFEEFAFRGYLQFTLTRGIAGVLRNVGMEEHAKAIGFWIAAVLLVLAFGGVHALNTGEATIGLFSAGLIGFAFAFSLWRTGSLWWAIGFHMAWDWAESYFYGTADSGELLPHRLMTSIPQGNPVFSGGAVGPEGSVWVFAVIALAFLLIALTLKPRPGSPAAEFAAKR